MTARRDILLVDTLIEPWITKFHEIITSSAVMASVCRRGAGDPGG